MSLQVSLSPLDSGDMDVSTSSGPVFDTTGITSALRLVESIPSVSESPFDQPVMTPGLSTPQFSC